MTLICVSLYVKSSPDYQYFSNFDVDSSIQVIYDDNVFNTLDKKVCVSNRRLVHSELQVALGVHQF